MANLGSHTARVVFLRWILPIFAVVTLIGVIAWPSFKEFQLNQLSATSKTALKVKDVSLSLPKDNKPMELTVNKPEYTGMDEKSRPFLVTADRVVQQGMQTGTPMHLINPVATLTVDKESSENVVINAVDGIYNPAVKTLQLSGPVTVTHSQGYVMNLQELSADMIKGTMISNHPVTGNGPGGTLEGESMEIRDRGDDIILYGRSKIVLVPKEK